MSNKILIVVDMQNDFITGSLGTPEAQAIVPKVQAKIGHGLGGDWAGVIFTMDIHEEKWYPKTLEGLKIPAHCIIGTGGNDLAVQTVPECDVLTKRCFGYMNWEKRLTNLQYEWYFTFGFDSVEFELCGVCTDICVISNALILRSTFPDAKITVDASCCAGTTPEAHKAALMVMKSCLIDVINEEE